MDEQLIEHYFNRKFTNAEILRYLEKEWDINISLSTLKRRLRKLGLQRSDNEDHLNDAIDFIENELKNSNQKLGYRLLHSKCRRRGLQIKRDSVSAILKFLDPEGVEQRRKGRLYRRLYSVEGPNYLWHLDGYDKIKPYGIAIHGCIDSFSRKLIWLQAASTNNDPKKIGNYYIDSIRSLNACPVSIRSDYGTENTDVEKMQTIIRNVYSESEFPPYLLSSSLLNQRIESFWSRLRKSVMQFYMNLFQGLKETGNFGGNPLDKSIIRFCFLRKIQDELDEFGELWDDHLIRKTKNSIMPAAKPVNMYELPEDYGTIDCLVEVEDMEEITTVLRQEFAYEDHSGDSIVHELLNQIMEEKNLTFASDSDGLIMLYIELRETVIRMLEE